MSHNRNNDFRGPIDIPASSSNKSTTAPLSISIPRRGSLSSSFSLASAGNPFLHPISPTTSIPRQPFGAMSPTNMSTSIPTASSGPSPSPPGPGILQRRFSVGFNPHSQIVPSAQDNPHGSGAAGTATTAGGLFRKFSMGGGGGGGGFDRNTTQDLHQPQSQPHSSIFAALHANKHKASSDQQQKQDHLTTVQHLKEPKSQDKISRSSSPMRSMILNGQMLD